MTKLYLIRHAEAEGNLYRRIHGQYDSIITENGYRQIEALAKRFEPIHIDAVYSSDLFRTMKTAKALYETKNLPLRTRRDLRELSLGIWEDKPWGEVDFREHDQMSLFCQSSPTWQVEGGENFESLRNRVSAAILDIARKHPHEAVAVVSHGTAIRYARAAFLGVPLEESRNLGHSDNTAVTMLEIENGNVNTLFCDDNSHLSEEISTLAQQSWWKNKAGTSPDENLWYEQLDLSQTLYKGLYLACRQEAWVDLKRDMSLFERQHYLENAEKCAKQNTQYLMCTMLRNTIVGVLQLDAERYKEDNAGYISFFYMLPEHRGRGLGVQMLGQAISTYRPMGRDKLRLACGEDNIRGMRFYEQHGFRKIASRQEAFGTINILEKYIGYE
jgi:probable phosphoglycerate mutase